MATLSPDFSNSRQRWSAPCPSQRYSTLQADPAIHAPSKQRRISSFQFGTPKQSELTAATIVEYGGDNSSTTSLAEPSKEQPREWKPSFIRVGPLIGLAALLLAFLQIFASFAVLKLSDGQAIRDWKFGPSVYIAILSTVSNGAIQLAATQGAVITFWLRVLGGTTLGQLHRDFAYGSEVYNALRCGKHINLIAIACIFATLVCVDGPLLQRASSTQSIGYHGAVKLNISLVPEVPSYFSGFNDRSSGYAEFSGAMLQVMNQYSSKMPITGGIHGCSGTCTTTVRAPALIPYRCISNTTWQNFSDPSSNRELFKTTLTSIYGSFETLDLHTYLTGDAVARTCAGTVNSTHCYLRSAIAEYEVVITNGTITLSDPASPRFVSWANNTAITPETINTHSLRLSIAPDWIKTTLAGIVNAFYFEYRLIGTANRPDPKVPDYLGINARVDKLFRYQVATNVEQYNNNKACVLAWKDVRPTAMAGLNELMFRMGVYAAQTYDDASLKDSLDPGVITNYTTIGMLHTPQAVFKSDFTFYYAAAALELLTIFLILSTFHGYWRLGRNVSFSPLEVAKAFGAAFLQSAASNSSGKNIESFMGHHRVRYGILGSEAERDEKNQMAGPLMISHREHVYVPEDGSTCV